MLKTAFLRYTQRIMKMLKVMSKILLLEIILKSSFYMKRLSTIQSILMLV